MSKKELTTNLADLTSLPVSAAQTRLANYKPPITYLQRLHLVSSGSAKYVTAKPPTAQAGEYGIPGSGTDIQVLGEAVDIIPFAVRDKALDTTENPPITCFDTSDELYQEIAERASVKDSGCLEGPSFLVFERTSGQFLEFFCGGKSAQMEAGKLGPYLPVSKEQAKQFGVEAKPPKQLTLRSKPIKRPRRFWYAPEVTNCSTPFTNLPPIETILEEIDKFNNPKTEGPELVKGEVRER